MRKLIVPLVVAGLVGPAVAPALAAAKDVKVGDNWFVRPSGVPTVTVNKGAKVRWVWKGDSVHNVKVTKGPASFGSGAPQTSGTYTKKVKQAGSYTLVCTVHGAKDQSMKLVVR